MISSMTAFARQSIQYEWGTATWELRSVNSRYLETNFRLPEVVRHLEMSCREKLRKKLQRGKLDCTLKLDISSNESNELNINLDLAAGLLKAQKELQALTHIQQEPKIMQLLAWPGMIKPKEMDTETMEANLLEGLDGAVEQLIMMRQREGNSLQALIKQRLDSMSEQVSKVTELMPGILQWQREKLSTRLQELKQEMDESRLEQEMVILAQKVDVEEEIDRLNTHIKEVSRLVDKGGVVGRRLDFLMQELNREANTLGSKSISSENTAISVELKVLIEQMREQIQNIE